MTDKPHERRAPTQFCCAKSNFVKIKVYMALSILTFVLLETQWYRWHFEEAWSETSYCVRVWTGKCVKVIPLKHTSKKKNSRTISILSNSSFCSRLINLSDSVGHQPQHCPHRRDMHDVTLCLAGSHLINFYWLNNIKSTSFPLHLNVLHQQRQWLAWSILYE